MKIKLALLDQDKIFLSRLSSVFANKYSDKVEIYSFTEEETAINSLNTERIDVFLASDAFNIGVEQIPARCSFAYFVENAEIESVREQRAVAKFQKAELLYKQILSMYAENASVITGFKLNDETATQIITFLSVSGGVGSSTMAAAFAVYAARAGKRVLYMDLERFGSTDNFFAGEGQFDFSDVLYALKSRKSNLVLKLESTVKQDASGVFFYSTPKMALDLMELAEEDIQKLLQEFRIGGMYDYIVLDIDFSFDKKEKTILMLSDKLVFVNDGTEISNKKLERACAAIQVLEEQNEERMMGKAFLLYNKFSNKVCNTIKDIGIRALGGAPKFEHATTKQVMEQLVSMQIFRKLL